MHNQIKSIAIKITLIAITASCTNRNTATETLCGSGTGYWDATIGYSRAFSCDGKSYEYSYDDKGLREKADYGDVRIDYFNWSVNEKILTISAGDYIRKYTIKYMDDSKMVVTDSSAEYGRSEITYTKAKK